jgi:hypothetical protein
VRASVVQNIPLNQLYDVLVILGPNPYWSRSGPAHLQRASVACHKVFRFFIVPCYFMEFGVFGVHASVLSLFARFFSEWPVFLTGMGLGRGGFQVPSAGWRCFHRQMCGPLPLSGVDGDEDSFRVGCFELSPKWFVGRILIAPLRFFVRIEVF